MTATQTLTGAQVGNYGGNAFRVLARLGYAARGVVYLIIGGLAAMAAAGYGGDTTGSKGALASLADEPFGRVLLTVVAVGLLGYAVWRFTQSYWDTDGHGQKPKGIAVRVGLMTSAVTHAFLAMWALGVVIGAASSSDDGSGSARWVAWLLEQPAGWLWVSLIGVAIIGAGVAQVVKGYRYKFERYLSFDYNRWPWARPLCRAGLVARGIVFGILGSFFLLAAWRGNSADATGLGGVLQWIGEQPWGWALLGATALGLISFGIYSILQAVYRRIDTPHTLSATPT